MNERRDARLVLTDHDRKMLEEQGYAGPFDLLALAECSEVIETCSVVDQRDLPWRKAWHMIRESHDLATRAPILDRIRALLGEDLLLWAGQYIRQVPSGRHNWHTDAEHIQWEGMTAWIALRNVTPRSTVFVIPGSHSFGVTPEDLRRSGLDLTSDTAVLEAARKISRSCEIVPIQIEDGQFFLFSRVWHASKNETQDPRFSMIFQFTGPSSKVRRPINWLDIWGERIPCVLACGQDRHGLNDVVRPDQLSTSKGLRKRGSLERLAADTRWFAAYAWGNLTRRRSYDRVR